jgi:bacterioferritin (cytochrome b1)
MERPISAQIIQILNEMLEEERAAVEAVIGLTAMATDPNEREMLQRIGGDEVWACIGLRERIEALGGIPSKHVSDFSAYVLSLEYFPERLRTFGRHQRLILERVTTLLAQRSLDAETKAFLTEMKTQHETDIAWCEQRAASFESTRMRGEPLRPQPPALPPVIAETAARIVADSASPPAVERPRRVIRRRTEPANGSQPE